MSKPITELSSPPHPSPSDIIGDIRIKRRLFRIATDQQKLLDRRTSWAQVLSGVSMPFLNVPPDVLENIKECHIRQLQASQSNEMSSSADEPVHVTNQKNAETCDQSSQAAQSEPDEEDDDKGSEISWAPSPTEHKHPPRKVLSKKVGDIEQSVFITQPPLISSPLQATKPTSAKRPTHAVFPPSSQDQEEPLEIEVPTGINDSVLSVSKIAVPVNATPPSAQIVPCTFDPSSTESGEKPKISPKQRPYKPLAPLYRPKSRGYAGTRKFLNLQSSTSTPITSSSVIPSTIPSETPRKGVPIWHTSHTISPYKDSPTGHKNTDVEDTSTPQTQHQSPEYRPQSPQFPSSPPVPAVARISPPTLTRPTPASHTPFIQYSITYPNYNGSIRDFVRACMVIQLQQKKIRTSLYDDFIRAWHQGYMQYVEECDSAEPPVKALNAIVWYNDIDDDPLFVSRVVTKQNLESILNFYPDELQSARSLLGISPNPTQETTSTPDATRLVNGKQPKPADKAMQVEIDSTMEDTDAPGVEEPKASPIAVPKTVAPKVMPLPKQRSARAMPVHKSFNGVEAKPTTAKGLTRSFSEAAPHKRKASEELSNAPSKRLSVNSLPRSRSGSVNNASVSSEAPTSTRQGSVAPSSTAGIRKKYEGDPKAKSAAFARYLEKRKARQQRPAGSAPGNNTPTSAQRE